MNRARDVANKNYAGRGISVDPRWTDFRNFLEDMGERPDGMTLERQNNNEGYSKANCVWATHTQQCNNRRSNRMITFDGRTQTVAQWGKERNFPKAYLITERIGRGWTIAEAICTPTTKGKTHNPRVRSLPEKRVKRSLKPE